ncbi:MAG: amine acid transporter, permease protein region, His/Glu/Gln/Arg/opine family [Clostridia bacterium]|jgi:cystine transport system permease protein|nr:amine acid transporter, permease protein region, His/Glu/Gln/Arg/opine family [Clostridia bacterium]
MQISDRILELIINSFWTILKPGLIYTIPLTLISFMIGLIIAIIVALIQISNLRILKGITSFYVWIIRGTPLLVQIFIIFYGLPSAGVTLEPLFASVIAFSLNVGAYSSETIRAAILSIHKGQWEAGDSLGMTYFQVLRRIILPQAAKVSIPPLFNAFIGLVKDTSLAANITVAEMFMVTQRIAAKTYEPLILYCEVAFIYLMFCTILSKIQSKAEEKLSIGQKI